MPTTITMPQLGETVTEGTVSQWLKKVGDTIQKYEPLVEVATDKVTAEVPSPATGTIRELIVKEGQTVPTGTAIAHVHVPVPAAGSSRSPAAPIRGVSPAVRRLAREHAVDVARVRGTGSGGRVTANDVLQAATATPVRAIPAAPALGNTLVLTHARKLIAQRMVESRRTAPHAWTMVEADVTNLWKWRASVKDAFARDNGVPLTLLPFFINAVAGAVSRFPLMNASWTDQGIVVHKDINVGIAVALDENLVVPVIRSADRLSVKGIALAAGALIDRARRNTLSADDFHGGTITVNNTGANGSVLSAPILVPGQTGIVTMEAVVKRPVVLENDAIAIRSMMNVCLSLDHRVIDGAIAGQFLSEVKRRLEAMGPTGAL